MIGGDATLFMHLGTQLSEGEPEGALPTHTSWKRSESLYGSIKKLIELQEDPNSYSMRIKHIRDDVTARSTLRRSSLDLYSNELASSGVANLQDLPRLLM